MLRRPSNRMRNLPVPSRAGAATATGRDRPTMSDHMRNRSDALMAERRHMRLQDAVEEALAHIRDYAIVVVDLDHRIAAWNRGAAHVFGYSSEEVLGRPLETFFSPEDRAAGVPSRSTLDVRPA